MLITTVQVGVIIRANQNSSIYYPGEARAHVGANQGQLSFSNSLGDGISGNGNIQGDPIYNDPNNLDFSLAPGSPCIGSGEGGTDMGADMSGNTNMDDEFCKFL